LVSRKPNIDKRSILPFGGKVLNFLFGVPTQSQLNKLKQTIEENRDSQSEVIDIVKRSVSIINTTYVKVKENRELIFYLQNLTYDMHLEIENFIDNVNQIFYPEFVYLELNNRLHYLFNVISNTIFKTKYEVKETLKQIQECIQGNLPIDVFPPSKFISAIKQIEQNLPNNSFLPFQSDKLEISMYYKLIKPLVIFDKDTVNLVMALPIISSEQTLTIYEALSLPDHELRPYIGFSYSLETNYIAVSHDNKFYSLIQKEETAPCLTSPICKLSSPLYSGENFHTCIFSLFLRDPNKIERDCIVYAHHHADRPSLIYLGFGKWVISSPLSLAVDLVCSGTPNKSVTLNSGFSSLTLHEGCSASSRFFKIPTYTFEKYNTRKIA
jgi:hypothetical protein